MNQECKGAKSSDWAILYLRVVVGGALLLHNVGKMQEYNSIIGEYSSMWGIAGTTWYIAFSFVEVTAAFMLIMGYWVRTASFILILGTISIMVLYFNYSTADYIELKALYILLYLLLLITGGGYYSMDVARCRRYIKRHRAKNNATTRQ